VPSHQPEKIPASTERRIFHIAMCDSMPDVRSIIGRRRETVVMVTPAMLAPKSNLRLAVPAAADDGFPVAMADDGRGAACFQP
jgi:hypothetical protein